MKHLWQGAGVLVIAFCSFSGCSDNGRVHEASAELPLARIDPASAGTIEGVVRYEGPKPAMLAIDFSSNPQCERAHLKTTEKAETVVVNPNGTLRNTLLWIRSGLPRARWEPPTTAVKLDQSGCVYRPHVLALMVNQELEILNSDPVNHDVHAESTVNPGFNESEPPRAETLHKRFSAQEVWFPITCSVHPWMKTYVAVVEHPFFAVTGDSGAFILKGVPPGEYTVEAVHEKFGRKTMKVNVGALQTARADFVYAE